MSGERTHRSKRSATPALGRAEEAALARAWRRHGDTAARNVLVSAYTSFAYATASAIAKGRGSLPDLRQEAVLGLLDAADRFDPDLGWRFSTYASWWIKARVNNVIIADKNLVSAPSGVFKKLYFALSKTIRAIEAEYRRDGILVTNAGVRLEASRRLKVSIEEIDAILPLVSYHEKSLDEPVGISDGEEGRSLVDLLPGTESSGEDALLSENTSEKMREAVRASLAILNDRDRSIVKARWLNDDCKVTLEELAVKHGVTREAIRQIEIRSFEKMAKHMARSEMLQKTFTLSEDKLAAARSGAKLRTIRRT